MNILIICEKNNAAKRISTILSQGKVKKTSHKRVPVFDFEKEGKSYTVVGLRGHILNLDYPPGYNNWHRIHPGKLINVEPIKKVSARSIYNTLRDLSKEADLVIIATDFDREGELIGVEGLEIVKKFNPEFTVKRAKFSSLTKSEITKAFNNLTEIDYNLSQSAESRQVSDLAWGAVLTRYISIAAKQTGKNFLSVGRVQSPTLALVVDREREIKNFTPTPYWEIHAKLNGPRGVSSSLNFEAHHKNGRFWDKTEAEDSYNRARKSQEGNVSSAKTSTKKERPPAPFNTTSFLRAAASRGLSPANAMSTAEGLYNRGILSYPRTDNTVYPSGLNLRDVLKNLKKSSFSKMADNLLKKDKLTPTRGKKQTTDHPPIYPVDAAKRSDLSKDEWKVYDLVVRRFFATLADPAKIEVIRVTIDIRDEKFRATGYRIIYKGWLEYYPYIKKKENILPKLSKDDKVDVNKIHFLSKETKPPGRYSQGGLIQLMDSKNLGTKSTRHEIIQKLYRRGYLTDSPPRPTDTAYSVIDTLEKYAEIVTKPDMTAKLEKDMGEIAEGKNSLEKVVSESREMLNKAMELLTKNRMEIRKEITSALKEQNTVGECRECGKQLMIRQSKYGKQFIGCSGYPKCTNTYPIPQRAKIVPTNKTCEECGAPVVKVIKRKKRPSEMCVNMDCPTVRNNKKKDSGKKNNAGKNNDNNTSK